jgi:hypothetical protein
MYSGSNDGAGDEENYQDGGETSNGEEGAQGSHDRHSRILRARCTWKTAAASYAFLHTYTYPVEKLNAA